jgi:hypothetical protein
VPVVTTMALADSAVAIPVLAVLLAGVLGLVGGILLERSRRAYPPRVGLLRTQPWRAVGELFQKTPWPPQERAQWHCEVVWARGYANSRFRAVAMEPHSYRKRTLTETEAFKWMLKADPDPATPGLEEGLGAVVARLEADGWEPTDPGSHWWSHRFLWKRPEPPPSPGRRSSRAHSSRSAVSRSPTS